MFSEIFYLLRSKTDGQYLVARVAAQSSGDEQAQQGYLLLFKEQFDALSYLNTHAADVVHRFAIESVSGAQLGGLIKRWEFAGVGIVQDPLIPRVEFLQHNAQG